MSANAIEDAIYFLQEALKCPESELMHELGNAQEAIADAIRGEKR